MMTIDDLVLVAAVNQQVHGFDPTFPEFIALAHTELSEAMEDFREGHALDEELLVDGKPCGIPSELADEVIRIAAFCGQHQIDLAGAITRKLQYNSSRPFKHGKVL